MSASEEDGGMVVARIRIERLPGERWAPIEGHGGLYAVSTHGRVLSRHRPSRPLLLATPLNNRGYRCVLLRRPDGKKVHYVVHRLVATAFCDRQPHHNVVRHLDDDRLNNHVDNLAWGTLAENEQDKIRNGRRGNPHKERCKNGHELTPENLAHYGPGDRYRRCRICGRANSRALYQRQKAARANER